MIASKHIISKENTELIHETFYPFTEKIDDQEVSQASIEFEQPESEILSQSHNQLQEDIDRIKQEINVLESTKENLKKEIIDYEDKKTQIQQEQESIRSQAQKIVEEHQKQAENILSEAQKKKEVIEAEIQNSKEQIVLDARKLGYREGFTKGYKNGEQEREEIEAYLKKILDESIRKKDRVVESIRQHLVDLVYTAVEKVVKKISNEDKKTVLRNIVDTLKKIDDPIKLIIKVNYNDLRTSSKFKSRLLASLKSLRQVEVVADPSVEVGGCIVETEFTIVDSRISTQLDKIGIALHSLDMDKSTTK